MTLRSPVTSTKANVNFYPLNPNINIQILTRLQHSSSFIFFVELMFKHQNSSAVISHLLVFMTCTFY